MKIIGNLVLISLGFLWQTSIVFAEERDLLALPLDDNFSTLSGKTIEFQEIDLAPFSDNLENYRNFTLQNNLNKEAKSSQIDCKKTTYPSELFTNQIILESVSGIESTITLPKLKTEKKPKSEENLQIDSFDIKKKAKLLPTVEEIARNHQLAKGDRLFLCGNLSQAEQVYREAKEPFPAQIANEQKTIPEPVYQPEKLQPGGAVYWRLYQEGLEDLHLESKILTPLQLLTEQYPEFIPGHLHYADILRETGDEEESMQVLQQAISLYPNEAELVRGTIEAYQTEEDWLEASITARQFALFNPKHPQSAEFTQLANTNLERYQDEIESDLTWNAIGNAIVGGVGFALTGNIFGPLSAVETSIYLIAGESSIGDRFSKNIQDELPMMRDEEVLGYVRGIGNKLASVAGRDEFEYEFHIIMDDRLNAFALPGGKIFINAGAILESNSEAELAGLLAHELAHTVLSHGFQLMAQGSLTANVTQYIPYVGGVAGDLLVFSYSREMEQQADLFGTRLLSCSAFKGRIM
ncbi:M48 family metalloprotease [Candidatus Gracilibacteria bacterium]|nr:M48 family metalloprotease [Candidatus Gracilibacteria bacterium]